jgi:hypothetical protein
MTLPGKRPSGPANDFNRAHGLGERGKYSPTGRISMSICSGTVSHGTLGQNVFGKKPGKIGLLMGLRDMHIWEVNPGAVGAKNCYRALRVFSALKNENLQTRT